MSAVAETKELVAALELVSKEAQDVLNATEGAEGSDLGAIGHNEVRAAANDARNIAINLAARLGVSLVKVDPVDEPEVKAVVSEKVLEELEAAQEAFQADEPREVPYTFGVSFLEDEFNAETDQSLEDTDKRLLGEFEELQQSKVALNHAEDKRREKLRGQFYSFMG